MNFILSSSRMVFYFAQLLICCALMNKISAKKSLKKIILFL